MSSLKPLVSVITPAYNHEKFIGKTIESVISQTYKNWEFLVVDDCSSDGSFDVIHEYAKKDSRIRIFRNGINRGLIPNWRFLIDNSRGDYIAFLEGDDFLHKDNLEKKIEVFERYPDVGMVYCDFDIVNSYGRVVTENYYRKNSIPVYKNEAILPEVYLLSSIAPFSTYSQIMIRRDTLLISGYPRSFDENAKIFLPSDWDFNFRISTRNKVYFVDASLLRYRKHEANNSSDVNTATQHYELLFKEYERNYSGNHIILKGIRYQRGKMHYLLIMYYLENQRKMDAWKEFIYYMTKYPMNVSRDFILSLKLFIRLCLPNAINQFIVKSYYGR